MTALVALTIFALIALLGAQYLDHQRAVWIAKPLASTGFVAVADQLETMLPNVQRARIPGAGGFPAWEYPDAVNGIVAEFFKQ